MSTDTEIVEVKEEEITSTESIHVENQYKIFEYFKEHTGLLVTCVSALVAIMSFILHFAVGRMNYAYLAYWDIGSLHANTSNQSKLDMVVCALLYILSLFAIHSFLGKTSDTYRYYNESLSIVKRSIKLTKETNKQSAQKLKKHEISYNHLSPEEKRTPDVEEIKKRIEESKEFLKESTKGISDLQKARRKALIWVAFQILVSTFLSYFIGSMFLFLLNVTVSVQEGIQQTRSIGFIIVVDLITYFVPAYFATRNAGKNLSNEEVLIRTAKLIENDIPRFPIQDFKKKGIMPILTDQKIKLAGVQSVVITVILLVTLTIAGRIGANQQRSFPIYTEGSTTYAIVYTSGSTRFMEEATIKEGSIVIDTTKQRIITSDDISYDVEVFDEVSVIRIDNTQKLEQHKISVKSIMETFGSFLEATLDKIGEVLKKDAECVSGT